MQTCQQSRTTDEKIMIWTHSEFSQWKSSWCISRGRHWCTCLGYMRAELRAKVNALVISKQAFSVMSRIPSTSHEAEGCWCNRNDASSSNQVKADPKADLDVASYVRTRLLLEVFYQFRDPIAEAMNRHTGENCQQNGCTNVLINNYAHISVMKTK